MPCFVLWALDESIGPEWRGGVSVRVVKPRVCRSHFRYRRLKIFQSKAKFATLLPAFSLFLPPTLRTRLRSSVPKLWHHFSAKWCQNWKKKTWNRKMTISTLSGADYLLVIGSWPCRSSLKDLSVFFTYWRGKIWNWASMGYSLATLSLNMSKLANGNKVPRFRRHYDTIIKEWK